MKKLTLIVHADTEQALADTLRALPRVSGFTFTRVEGHGTQDDSDAFLSARDRVVGYTPHVQVDILLEDADVDDVVRSLQQGQSGVAGRGRYWVTSVEKGGRL